jgi:hypothetical protein
MRFTGSARQYARQSLLLSAEPRADLLTAQTHGYGLRDASLLDLPQGARNEITPGCFGPNERGVSRSLLCLRRRP